MLQPRDQMSVLAVMVHVEGTSKSSGALGGTSGACMRVCTYEREGMDESKAVHDARTHTHTHL